MRPGHIETKVRKILLRSFQPGRAQPITTHLAMRASLAVVPLAIGSCAIGSHRYPKCKTADPDMENTKKITIIVIAAWHSAVLASMHLEHRSRFAAAACSGVARRTRYPAKQATGRAPNGHCGMRLRTQCHCTYACLRHDTPQALLQQPWATSHWATPTCPPITARRKAVS